MLKKLCLGKPFKSQQAKGSENRQESAWQHFYQIS